MVALAAFAAVSCGHGPDIILITVLPIDAPEGQNESLMYAMCTDPPHQRPDDALRVRFVNDRGVVFEQTVRCEIARRKYKPTAREVLSPARVRPVKEECTLPITEQTDGNVAPLLCPNGGVNVTAWHHYASGPDFTWSKTMALGRRATAAQVSEAMCVDYRAVYGTRPRTISAERLASAYYGWTFASDDPVARFERHCSSD